MSKSLKHIHEVHGWTIGIIDDPGNAIERGTMFKDEWHITTNDAGEYFIWDRIRSETMLAWIRVVPSADMVFSTCTMAAHVMVRYAEKRIEIAILDPGGSLQANQPSEQAGESI